MTDEPCSGVFATIADGDTLIAELRRRVQHTGASYASLEELAGMSEGALGKYLSPLAALGSLAVEAHLGTWPPARVAYRREAHAADAATLDTTRCQ
jgi:hypothetical protein